MEFLILILLLLMNGLFAMYEIALVSSSRSRLENMQAKGNKKAKLVLKQLDDTEKYLSTIQIGITLIGIISGAFGGVTLAHQVAKLFDHVPWLQSYADELAMVLTVTFITYLSIVIGELVPKSIGLANPEKYACNFCRFIQFLSKIAKPFVFILSASTKGINQLIGISTSQKPSITEEELKLILHQSSEAGVLDQNESEMLKDVFRFSDKRANELMTSRPDIVVLHIADSKEMVFKTIKESNFSKYLLVDQNKDSIIGVVSVKDIFLMQSKCDADFDLRSIAQPALYIPETLPANKVLELFKQNKKKFGVVVNEYGYTEGIITLHDLSESIFGDILEENENTEEEITVRKDGSMLVDASMNIDDFMDEMGISDYDDLKEEDFNTLSGLAMLLIGRLPQTGDTFSYKDLHFEIVDMDAERVDKLLVHKEGTDEETDAEEDK